MGRGIWGSGPQSKFDLQIAFGGMTTWRFCVVLVRNASNRSGTLDFEKNVICKCNVAVVLGYIRLNY